jgi:hypothetical protein
MMGLSWLAAVLANMQELYQHVMPPIIEDDDSDDDGDMELSDKANSDATIATKVGVCNDGKMVYIYSSAVIYKY